MRSQSVLQDLDPGEVLVVGFDQGPGARARWKCGPPCRTRRSRTGPIFAVAPVFVGDLERLNSVSWRLEAAQLFVGGNLEPEFDDHRPCRHQLVLEIVDLGVGPQPVGFGAEALDPLDQYPAVPTSGRRCRCARCAAGAARSARGRAGRAPPGGRGDGNDLVLAGVDGLDRASDGCPLPAASALRTPPRGNAWP